MPSYTNSRHFGQMVAHRRRELGLKPWQLHDNGGPVQATVEKIELGLGVLTHSTLVRIDQSLNWPPGSSERVLTTRRIVNKAVAQPKPPVATNCEPKPPSPRRTARDGLSRHVPQQRAVRTRASIIAAVAGAISDMGASAPIKIILEAADTTKGAMYFHFDSKDALWHAMLDAAADESLFLDDHVDQPRSSDPEQAVDAVLADYLERAAASPLLRAEAVLLTDPDYATPAALGTHARLRTVLTAMLVGSHGPDTGTVVEAIMAVLTGLTTTPGPAHGLAASGTAQAIRRYAALLIRPVRA